MVYVRLKTSSITEKDIMVNGAEVWTLPGILDGWWIDNGLTHGWLFSAVLLAYLHVYGKNSGKFPAFYFSVKVTTLVLITAPSDHSRPIDTWTESLKMAIRVDDASFLCHICHKMCAIDTISAQTATSRCIWSEPECQTVAVTFQFIRWHSLGQRNDRT